MVMRFLEATAIAFFRTFGITQPSQEMLRRAVWFLVGLTSLILLAFAIGALLVFHVL